MFFFSFIYFFWLPIMKQLSNKGILEVALKQLNIKTDFIYIFLKQEQIPQEQAVVTYGLFYTIRCFILLGKLAKH